MAREHPCKQTDIEFPQIVAIGKDNPCPSFSLNLLTPRMPGISGPARGNRDSSGSPRAATREISASDSRRRDQHFVSGLAVDVMGWTGPLAQGATPYTVAADFVGRYASEIVVVGANKTEVVHVEEVAFESEEGFMRAHTASAP